jgi:hypothetical protein
MQWFIVSIISLQTTYYNRLFKTTEYYIYLHVFLVLITVNYLRECFSAPLLSQLNVPINVGVYGSKWGDIIFYQLRLQLIKAQH